MIIWLSFLATWTGNRAEAGFKRLERWFSWAVAEGPLQVPHSGLTQAECPAGLTPLEYLWLASGTKTICSWIRPGWVRARSAWIQSWLTNCRRENTAQQKTWLGVGHRACIEKKPPKTLLWARIHMLSVWAHSVWGVLSLISHGPVALVPFLHPSSSWRSYKCWLLVARGSCEMGQHSPKFMLPRPECLIPLQVESTFFFLWDWIILY